MRNYFLKRTSGAPLNTLSKLYDVTVGFVPPSFEAVYCYICNRRRVAVARYRMICLVLVYSHLFPLPCGLEPVAQFPAKGLTFKVLLFFHHCSSFRCWAAVTLCCGIAIYSRFSQVECTFSNIPTGVHLPVGRHYLVLLALTFRYRVVLWGHLIVDHFYEKIKYIAFPLMYPLEMSILHVLILHSC